MFKSISKQQRGILLGVLLGVGLMASLGAVTWTPSGGNYEVTGGATNQVSAPALVTTTSNAVALEATETSGSAENVRLRVIQNVGTVPVLYCLGGTASVSNFHGILAPGTAARDGLGSVLDITSWRGSVSIAVESGTGVVATVEIIK